LGEIVYCVVDKVGEAQTGERRGKVVKWVNEIVYSIGAKFELSYGGREIVQRATELLGYR
jgi:hypothetical protein